MEIRDPVHGFINIPEEIVPVIRNPFFKRLRHIRQLGLTPRVFPGATHSRYNHSLGVMYVGDRCFEQLFSNVLGTDDYLRIGTTLQLACMLHDIGHAPFSHATEPLMPKLSKLDIPEQFISDADKASDRRATHEDYTIKIVTDSSFTPSLKLVGEAFGVDPAQVAHLILGRSPDTSYFTVDGVDYFPILHQLVSSEMDCDRMDYLLRDSYFCGVSYGEYDLDWVIRNLEIAVENGRAYLGISERALVTFNDFLLSRYHMFIMVYFHYKSVCLENLLYKYIHSGETDYSVPHKVEEYLKHDDNLLLSLIRDSSNKYAKAIENDSIPKKIYESFNPEQSEALEGIKSFLEKNNIEYIHCSSHGRLSKYYLKGTDDGDYKLKVVRHMYNGVTKHSNIEDVTNLFMQFRESHRIDRIHCETDTLSDKQYSKLKELIEQ